jgi:hypothetical protein
MKKIVVIVVALFVLLPAASHAGMLTFMAADQARQEAEKARKAIEAMKDPGGCKVESEICGTCAIHCADGITATCVVGVVEYKGCTPQCKTPPSCRCGS